MKFVLHPPLRHQSRQPLWRCTALLSFVCVFVLPFVLKATPPGWWLDWGVIDPTQDPNDYAAVNQGQVKLIATQAAAEMDAHLPGGSGSAVQNLVGAWGTPTGQSNDYAPVNLAMLRYVAKPFYDQLFRVGYITTYPSFLSSNVDNYAAANIGQVKNLFSFDLMAVTPANDLDGDGIPDWWEKYYFPSTYGTSDFNPNAKVEWGDMTILQSFQQGLNPTDFYNNHFLQLSVSSPYTTPATPASGYAGSLLGTALTVQVNDASGSPMINAPVQFTITTVLTGGGLMAKSSSTPAASMTAWTNGQGQAHVYLLLPPLPTVPDIKITVTAGTAAPVAFDVASVNSSGTTGPGSGGPNDPPNPPLPPGGPFSPTNVSATLNSDGSLDVSWVNNQDNDSSDPIPVQVKLPSGSYGTQTVAADQTSAHFDAPAQ